MRTLNPNITDYIDCGQEWPTYQIFDINGVCLGCETCLTIKKEGVMQL